MQLTSDEHSMFTTLLCPVCSYCAIYFHAFVLAPDEHMVAPDATPLAPIKSTWNEYER